MDSNEKAYCLAEMGLVHVVAVDTMNRPTEAHVPAQGGEYAIVKLSRSGLEARVSSCIHHRFLGGSPRPCEAHTNGLVCYHAKAVLVWVAKCKNTQAILCRGEAEARSQGGIVGCLCVGRSKQWIAFIPSS